MRPKTLLVVDDEPANVELIRMIVEDASLPVQSATAGVRIVAVTAQAMPGDRAQALAAGCDDDVTKPLDVRAIRGLLEAYLR